jgi:hypothetical protein
VRIALIGELFHRSMQWVHQSKHKPDNPNLEERGGKGGEMLWLRVEVAQPSDKPYNKRDRL